MIRAALGAASGAAPVVAHHDGLRSAGFAQYVESLAGRGLLAPDCDLHEVTDVFMTLLGSDVYLAFTADRGWSVDRYVSWATGTLAALFLREPVPGASPAP